MLSDWERLTVEKNSNILEETVLTILNVFQYMFLTIGYIVLLINLLSITTVRCDCYTSGVACPRACQYCHVCMVVNTRYQVYCIMCILVLL